MESKAGDADEETLRRMLLAVAAAWPGERSFFTCLITQAAAERSEESTDDADGGTPAADHEDRADISRGTVRYMDEKIRARQEAVLSELKAWEEGDLRRIVEGDVRIRAEYICDWEDYDNGCDEDFRYYGMEEAGKIIKRGSALVDDLCDCDLYREALDLAGEIGSLKVEIDCNYSGISRPSMGFREIDSRVFTFRSSLIELRALNCVQKLYSGTAFFKESFRIMKLFGEDQTEIMLKRFGDKQRKMRDGWFAWLAGCKDRYAGKIAARIMNNLKDPDELLSLARQHYRKFPRLYTLTYEALKEELKNSDGFDAVSMELRFGNGSGSDDSGAGDCAHEIDDAGKTRSDTDRREFLKWRYLRDLAREALEKLDDSEEKRREYFLEELETAQTRMKDSYRAKGADDSAE